MAFGIGDELSVKVGADTADFRAGMAGVQRRLDGVKDKANETTRSFAALSASTDGLAVNLGILGGVSTATAGSLAALSTTVVPLVATLGGLATAAASVAGAFGLILGSGIIAFGEKRGEQNRQRLQEVNAQIEALEDLKETEAGLTEAQQEQLASLEKSREKLEEQTGVAGGLSSALSDLKSELTPIVVEFGQRFIPLIEDAIEALPALVESIFEAVGGTEQFRRTLREFGSIAMQALPAITGLMFDIARGALPALQAGLNWLLENGGSIFDGFQSTTNEVLPLLGDLAESFSNLLPQVNQVGITMASILVPAVVTLTNTLTRGLRAFNQLPRNFQRLAAGAILLAPLLSTIAGTVTTLSTVIGFVAGGFGTLVGALPSLGLLSGIASIFGSIASILGGGLLASIAGLLGPIALVVGAIVGLGLAFQNNFNSIQTLAQQALSTFRDLFNRLRSTWQKVGKPLLGPGGEFEQTLNTLRAFWKKWGDGISQVFNFLFQGVIGIAQTGFDLLLSLVSAGLNLIQGDWKEAWNDIAGFLERTLNGLLSFGSKWGQKFLDAIIGSLPKELRSSVRDAIGSVQNIDAPRIQSNVSSNIAASQNNSSQQRILVERQEKIRFEGDGEISEMFAEQANRQIEQRERRTERNAGRTSGI